jgi:hypothetical protein
MKWSHIQQQLTGATSTAEVDLVAKVDELCSFRSLKNVVRSWPASSGWDCSRMKSLPSAILLSTLFPINWKDFAAFNLVSGIW